MTSVACNEPVVAPDAWLGREARPQFYHGTQIRPLMRSRI